MSDWPLFLQIALGVVVGIMGWRLVDWLWSVRPSIAALRILVPLALLLVGAGVLVSLDLRSVGQVAIWFQCFVAVTFALAMGFVGIVLLSNVSTQRRLFDHQYRILSVEAATAALIAICGPAYFGFMLYRVADFLITGNYPG